jgi:hypothetical protein
LEISFAIASSSSISSGLNSTSSDSSSFIIIETFSFCRNGPVFLLTLN